MEENTNTNHSEPVNPIVNKDKEIGQKISKRRWRSRLTCFSGCLVILMILIVVGTGIFVWANGSLKRFVCSNSLKDSFIYKEVNCSDSTTDTPKSTFEQGKTLELDTSNLNTQEELITKVVEETSESIVTIVATSPVDPNAFESGNLEGSKQNIGSGFVVRSDGVIVTNSHVVDNASLEYSVIIGNDKNTVPVDKVYLDRGNDIAILKVNKNDLQALKLGDSDKLKRGNMVIAIGSPLGDLTGTVTSGIVSGLNRDVNAGSTFGTTGKKYQGVIQTDAPINPGNSGGPLFNSKAEVIGINFATTSGADNISFALPINRLKVKLSEFAEKGKLLEPFIGVSFTQRTYYLKDTTLNGALITLIQVGSPSDKAGLKKGDVVTKANGKSLETESFLEIIQGTPVGSTLNLEVWRKGVTQNISIPVGDRSDYDK